MPICPRSGQHLDALGVPTGYDAFSIRERAWDASRQDPLLGQRLARRYILVDILGSGTMGTVYEAIQDGLQRRCAVKVLKRDLTSHDQLRKRFQREAEVVARLNHPHIVTLYDFGVLEDATSFIAMEFIDGTPLSSRIPYDGLPQTSTLDILHQLLLALAEAHRLNIVHRDLKPDNILLCERAGRLHIKVLDFGLAKLLESNEQTVLTVTGEVVGTPLYMSPEQTTGTAEITYAADVYAFGAIAFELFTGRPPFDAPTPLAIMMQHVNAPIPEMRPREEILLSQNMHHFIRRCLEKKPSDRFENAIEVIREFLATEEMQRLEHSREIQSVRRSSAALARNLPPTPSADADANAEDDFSDTQPSLPPVDWWALQEAKDKGK